MLAQWTTGPAGLTIARPRSKGADQPFTVRSFANVSMGGGQYWSLIVDGARELFLCEDDVVALEVHFERERFELGGAELSSPAADAETAIVEVLSDQRADALEAFAPRLIEAMGAALQACSTSPLRSFLEADSKHAACSAWLAQALVRPGRDEGASWNESAIEALRSFTPTDAELELDRVQVDFGFQRIVLALCREGVEIVVCLDGIGGAALLAEQGWAPVAFPPCPDVLLRRALDAMENADLDEALTLLDEALQQPGVPPAAYFHRGNVLVLLERIEEALDSFAQAEELMEGAQRLLARGNRATLLARLGEGEAAAALLAQSTQEFPDYAESWYGLGLSLVKLGRYDESVAATERAIELDPSHANAHYTIACAFALRGGPVDRDRAIEHVGAALACDGELRSSIAEDEDFAALRDDPRFLAVVSGA